MLLYIPPNSNEVTDLPAHSPFIFMCDSIMLQAALYIKQCDNAIGKAYVSKKNEYPSSLSDGS